MHALRNRILSAIGTGLALHGVTGCGGVEAGLASDANAEMAAPDRLGESDHDAIPGVDASVDAIVNGGVDAIVEAIVEATDATIHGDKDGSSDAVTTPEAFAESGVVADADPDGSPSCACSMTFGPCGAANPCGCCVGYGLVCSGNSVCISPAGRPFLVGTSMRSATPAARGDWMRDLAPSSAISQRTAHALQRAWLHDALQEHASVAAFARFTLQLLAVGAPPELIVASQRASLDEVAHARACFGLARRYGACGVGPSSLNLHDALGPTSIVLLCASTAAEGCVGETLGAALALEQLGLVKDAEVAKVLRKIATDEMRHAELAWRFARWAVEREGELAWRAIERSARDAVAATRQFPVREDGVDGAAWNAHGRLTSTQARRANDRAIVEVVEPSLAALAQVAAFATRQIPATQSSGAGVPARGPLHWCHRA